MKGLTSGRMDPVHPGHICNILRILKQCDTLKVVVLDYPQRRFPIDYCIQVVQEVFADNDRVEFIVNATHFGKITKDEIHGYNCDTYFGGNFDVLNHIHGLEYPVKYVERAFEYSARDIPRPEK